MHKGLPYAEAATRHNSSTAAEDPSYLLSHSAAPRLHACICALRASPAVLSFEVQRNWPHTPTLVPPALPDAALYRRSDGVHCRTMSFTSLRADAARFGIA